MNTNSIPYLDQLLQWSDQMNGLPALPLVFLGCLASGYVFAAIPVYKNRWIPAGVFAVGVVFNLSITPLDNLQAGTRAVILGLIAGGASWLFHKLVLSRWIDVTQFKAGDTIQITKPPEETKHEK